MSRHHDFDRSRQRHGYRGRSQSPPDSNQKRKKVSHHRSTHQQISKPEPKRVKFNDVPDIKVFRKQDQPNSKGLTDAQIDQFLKKIETEKGFGGFGNNNWEKMKHFDAQLQSNSIKEQKQKQKILHQKLQMIRQQIPFYSPLPLRLDSYVVTGEGSTEKSELSSRLNDVLGCFYVQQSQIPPEPIFQIQNKSTSTAPKLISFDKQRMENKDLANAKKKEKKDQKPLKGILKLSPQERTRERSESAPRKISPALIQLLKQMQNNKSAYPKERAEMLLKPYKDSGELDYIKNNPSILTELMRSSSMSNSVQRGYNSNVPQKLPQPYQKPSYSISPLPEKPQNLYSNQPYKPQMNKPYEPMKYTDYNQPTHNYNNYGQYGYYQNYQGQNQHQHQQHQQHQHQHQHQQHQQHHIVPQNNPSSMMPLTNMYNPPTNTSFNPPQNNYNNFQSSMSSGQSFNRNYKTVPCKYFHSPQGCVKANGCTYIHDQQFAGRPTPSMLKSNRGMVMTSYNTTGNDNPQMGNNFYQPYSNDHYQGQN